MKKLIRITTVPESIVSLLQGQLRCMNNYFDVVAISSGGPDFNRMLEQERVRGISVDMTRKITPFLDFVALVKMIAIFRKEKPDIVHTHTPKAGIIGMLAAWLTCVPCRLHTVAGMPLLAANGYKRRLLFMVEKLTYACATKVYPNSRAMKDIILELKLVKSEKLSVIANGSSNGIDTSFFSPLALPKGRDVIRKELSIGVNDFVFIYVGRVVKDKGINELVSAFCRVLEEGYTKSKLLIVGRFEEELDPISSISRQMILNNHNILFQGYQRDVRPYFVAADALVFPSYREGFPNVVMQAGAMGLPSIVSDINGCNEIIVNGRNGLIVPPRDEDSLYNAMVYFIKNPEIVKKNASNSREMISSRYERNMVVNALLSEYRRQLGTL